MSKSFNHTTLEGHLTRDPESSFTKNNTQVCKFSIACNDDYKDQSGNKVEQVSFFNIEAWSKLAETITKYLHKGDRVLVSGKLKQSRWQDEAGQKKSAVSLTANEVHFLKTQNSGDSSQTAAPAMTGQPQSTQPPQENFDNEPLGNDEVPF